MFAHFCKNLENGWIKVFDTFTSGSWFYQQGVVKMFLRLIIWNILNPLVKRTDLPKERIALKDYLYLLSKCFVCVCFCCFVQNKISLIFTWQLPHSNLLPRKKFNLMIVAYLYNFFYLKESRVRKLYSWDTQSYTKCSIIFSNCPSHH